MSDFSDPVFLARLQFAFAVSFHIVFPAFTIGLASFLVVLEALWYRTRKQIYLDLSVFWTKIFAVSFGMGVVSGVVMSFQFGTNWSRFSDITGNVMGPLLNYEVVTAFFMEATFLGILLFGRDRVPPLWHFISAIAVAVGTLLSSFWILSANSWMHTPDGFIYEDGMFYVKDWWDIVFNPSFPYRFAHMVTAAYLTTAFVVAGVSALYLLQKRFVDHARPAFNMGLGLITVLAPLQLVLGDLHGLNTLEHQPVKVAAMEGHWEPQKGAPLILFAIPDTEEEDNHAEIAIPKLGSFILTHDLNGEVPGLKEWDKEDRPFVPTVFASFRVMVGIGLLMIFVGLFSVWLRFRRKLYEVTWFKKFCVAMIPSGFIAILAGWVTTEVGRQPWIVYGILRTQDAASPAVTTGAVATSLIVFVVVYAIIFPAGAYYIYRLVSRGPTQARKPRSGARRPKRPLSASDEPYDPNPDSPLEPAKGGR